MTPEVTTAMAIVSVIDKMGGWSVGGMVVFTCLTPAIFVYLSARIVARAANGLRNQVEASEKESAQRFQTFQRDYQNNIRFVEEYSRLANRLEDTLRRNTIMMTKLVERIDTMREAR